MLDPAPKEVILVDQATEPELESRLKRGGPERSDRGAAADTRFAAKCKRNKIIEAAKPLFPDRAS
jgi:hypothetical protein